nr:hypothetical protein [Tanacetum cinerariifolium]
VETPLFENILVVRAVDAEDEVQVPTQDDVVQENVIEEVVAEVVPPTPTSPLPPSPQVLEKCSALVLRVEGLENANTAQQVEILKLKAKDVEDVFNQGRMSVDMETDEGIELEVDQEKDAQVAAASAPIPAAKPKFLKIAAAAPADKGKGILIEDPKPMKKKEQVEMDAEYAKRLQEELEKGHEEAYKNIDWNAAFDHVQAKETQFDANLKFLFKTREEMEKEDEEIIKSINETPAQKAAKRRKLNEEAQEADNLRRRLEIVPNEDDDVFVEAVPLAQKDPIVDYHVVVVDNRPKYKIIRADDTHQFYISFITLLKNFDREDLEALWRIVKDRFYTKKPTNFLDEYLLLTLKTMFGELDEQDAIWRNQKSVHGLSLVKRWKLLTSCGVHVEEESEMSLELLRFTRQQLLENQQG